MASFTKNYDLEKLADGEGIHSGFDRFGSDDRDVIDEETRDHAIHHHTGETSRPDAPTLTTSTTGGSIEGDTMIWYKISFVDPDDGESISSNFATTITDSGTDTNSVEVDPGTIPSGNTWKIYRSFDADFSESFLVQNSNSTATYTDTGAATSSTGPVSEVDFNLLTKVDLQDGAEVKNKSPLGILSGFPYVVPFYRKFLTAGDGVFLYTIERPTATLLAARAVLKTAASTNEVQVDIDLNDPFTTSIFDSATPQYLAITAGNLDSGRTTPTTTDFVQGDVLRGQVIQGDGDAVGLTITLYFVTVYDTTTTGDFEL